jgi:hypothetical protein
VRPSSRFAALTTSLQSLILGFLATGDHAHTACCSRQLADVARFAASSPAFLRVTVPWSDGHTAPPARFVAMRPRTVDLRIQDGDCDPASV